MCMRVKEMLQKDRYKKLPPKGDLGYTAFHDLGDGHHESDKSSSLSHTDFLYTERDAPSPLNRRSIEITTSKEPRTTCQHSLHPRRKSCHWYRTKTPCLLNQSLLGHAFFKDNWKLIPSVLR